MNKWKFIVFLILLKAWMVSGMPEKRPRIIGYYKMKNSSNTVYFQLDAATMAMKTLVSSSYPSSSDKNLAANSIAKIFCRSFDATETSKCHGVEEATTFLPALPKRSPDETSRYKNRISELNPYGDHLIWQEKRKGGLFVTNLRSNTSFLLIPSSEAVALFTVDWNNGIIYLVTFDSNHEVVKIRIPKLSHTDDGIQMPVFATLPDTDENIRGLAFQSDASETVYWLSRTSLYRGTSDGSVVQLISNLTQAPSSGSLQYYDGFLYWFQGVSVRESKSLIIYDILTGNLISKKMDLKNRQLRRLVIYEDKTEGVENGCEKLNCSHICIPYYKSQFQCVCPWGLKLLDGRQCAGTEIATFSNIGSSLSRNGMQLTWYDLGTGSRASQQLDCEEVSEEGSEELFEKKDITWILTTTYFEINEARCITNYSSNPLSAVPTYYFMLPFKSVPAYGSSLQENIHFFVNGTGCLRRLDLSTSTWWTLICLPGLGRGQSALDVDRWILFWEDEGKSGFRTELMTKRTRPYTLFDPRNSRGREPSNLVALDSHNMKVYLLSLGFLGVTNYNNSVQTVAYTLKYDGDSVSNLIFSERRLYWLEHFYVSQNDYLVTFDPVYEVKERIFMSNGILGFQVRPKKITMKISRTLSLPKCSHFTVPTNKNSFVCSCPAEVPALINGSTCTSLQFLIATREAGQQENFNSIDLHFINSGVEESEDDTSVEQIKDQLSIDHFSTFKSEINGILCHTGGESAHEKTAIDCEFSNSEYTTVIRHSTGSVQLMAIGADGDTIYYQTLHDGCIHLYSLKLVKSFKSACVNQNLTFAIDTQRHIIFWCQGNLVVYMALGAMGGNVSESTSEFSLSECNALAVNEYKAELLIMKRRFIISIDYSNLHVERQESNLRELTYKYYEGLQYYAENVFWIGGLSQAGEFIEFFCIQRDAYGKAIGSFNFQRIFKDEFSGRILRFQIFEPVVEHNNWLSPCNQEINKCDTICLITDPIPPTETHSTTCLSSEESGVTTTHKPHFNNETFQNQGDGSVITNDSLLISCTTVAIIFVFLVGILCVRSRRARRNRLQNAVADLVKGDSESPNVPSDPDTAALAPFTMSIPPEQIHVYTSKVLGSGQFGIVYSGRYNDINVALKTIKYIKNPELRENLVLDFIRELKIMAYIGEHDNVVRFYGAEISRIHDGKAYAVIELSPIGSLKAHLINLAELQLASHHYINISQSDDRDLGLMGFSEDFELMIWWARQIACGMRHLEEKHIVHGDLATRNVLVFEGGQKVKLTDFGLSRNLYKSDYYKKYTNAPIPFRWSAIEILEKREFSTKADVWSYGVTIWEIFTYGSLPYAECEWDKEFVPKLKAGMRLPKPNTDMCHAYEKIMQPCWEIRGRDRPLFSSIEQACLMILNEMEDSFGCTKTSGLVKAESTM